MPVDRQGRQGCDRGGGQVEGEMRVKISPRKLVLIIKIKFILHNLDF